MPVTAFSSEPSISRIPPITSSCHSSIAWPRSQRRYARRPGRRSRPVNPSRRNARPIAATLGTGSNPSRPSR
jgi:hypothetical protein